PPSPYTTLFRSSGKSTLFNALTGARQKVGNWPGVTVEKKTGHCHHGETLFEVVDLPGTYGLHLSHGDDSIDQQIAQRFILSEPVDLLVNIIDASSLERGLYLSTQLLDAGVPLVIALNMMDVANQQGVHIDPYELSSRIGVPVVPIVASRKEGIGNLLDVVVNHLASTGQRPVPPPVLGEVIESAIVALRSRLRDAGRGDRRLEAAALLERDAAVLATLPEELAASALAVVDDLERRAG